MWWLVKFVVLVVAVVDAGVKVDAVVVVDVMDDVVVEDVVVVVLLLMA